ncbi:MBL fold metallo-hydrolase [Halorubrum vacuolatum]|uniref:Metallo-beta-lactamase superfamily protein n=1 Tax=Halorubrum vacuolatum TaxID=63740 RepID=A0A238Y6V0_HALVU|nr:MBL fold metallo-hydrolase [Halorubrum vacuolatum]SNR66740.1 Metallo-beta-lactamase superfamily protein [Halorubrum vacuolatum]
MTERSPVVRELDVPGIVYDITWQAADEGPEITAGERHRTYFYDFEDDVPTLIDTCFQNRVEYLFEGIEQIGVEPERLLITHRHLDHIGAFDEVVERYDLETWVHEKDNVAEIDDYGIDIQTEPDHLFVGGEQIGRFEAVHVPGHSPGNSVFIDEKAGIAHCGDTVCGSDRRGLPPGYLLHPPQATHTNQPPESAVEAEENLAALLDYDFEVALLNHGRPVFENASDKLERYVNFESNFATEGQSIHATDRKTIEADELYSRLDEE